MMDLTWYILGVLTGFAAYASFLLSRKYSLSWLSLAGLGAGVVLVLFSVAWSVGAVLEGVPRAGSMGMLLFGLPGIVVLTLTGRLIVSQGGQDQ
jgi:hypothetical protein